MIPCIARTCVAVGVDGLFMEVHDDPLTSPVDAPTQWPLRNFESLLEELVCIANASKVIFRRPGLSEIVSIIVTSPVLICRIMPQGKEPFDIDLTPVGEEFP
jgi:hypothetical protein